MSLKADDKAIIKEAPWGQKLGDPVDKNLYGIPSPYEHNNIRRTTTFYLLEMLMLLYLCAQFMKVKE